MIFLRQEEKDVAEEFYNILKVQRDTLMRSRNITWKVWERSANSNHLYGACRSFSVKGCFDCWSLQRKNADEKPLMTLSSPSCISGTNVMGNEGRHEVGMK